MRRNGMDGPVVEMLDRRPIGAKGGGRRREHRLVAIDARDVARPDRAFNFRRDSEHLGRDAVVSPVNPPTVG